MIVGKDGLRKLVEENHLLENFSMKALGGAGYDLRLDKIYQLKSESYLGVADRKTPEIREISFEEYTLNPNEYVLVETLEKVNMPENLMARILPRSTLFRCGVTLITAVVDPGFQGTLTMGLKNISNQEFKVERGARIAQIVFEEVAGKTEKYNGKYQGGKVV
ncbi:MAG: dCTP deaminase [Candidatus Altiarchaeota archaeon]